MVFGMFVKLMKGLTAIAVSLLFVACNKDIYETYVSTVESSIVQNYENAFLTRFGQPAPTQDWGFSDAASGTRGLTRSQASPEVPHVLCPVSDADVTAYMASATAVTSENANYNYNGSNYIWYSWQNDASTLQYNPSQFTGSEEDRNLFETYCRPFFEVKNCWDGSKTWNDYFGCADEAAATLYLYKKLDAAGKWTLWVNGFAPTFVKNFKINEGTSWMGNIPVLASEDELARTIYVKGTWNVTANQSVGGRGNGLVVICDGGTINVSSGVQMIFDNEARLVVLPGGRLTGLGSVKLANGTAEGLEAYNGGTIDVYKFDNNYGKLFNYGTFSPTIYAASSTNSNIYNHGIVHIRTTKENGSYVTPNARIFNACQWYCEEDMNFRNLEMTSGSSMIVGGELKAGTSGDGTSDDTYAALGAGALVRCGTFVNNLTCWTGPASGGYAVLSAGKVTYLNWSSDGNCLTNGYIENNIYIQVSDMTNNPEGNNYWREGVDMNAAWKLKYILANGLDGNLNGSGRGNGGAKLISEGSTEVIAADEDFDLGVKGCSPGFWGDLTEVPVESGNAEENGEPEETGNTGDSGSSGDSGDSGDSGETGNTGQIVQRNSICRICVEDLSVTSESNDFDFNDVVFDVCPNDDGQTTTLVIRAVGGELPLYIEEQEVHMAVFGSTNKEMMNVGRDNNGVIDFNKECGTIVINRYIGSRDEASNINMYVKRSTGDFPITAFMGQVPSMICVGTDYEWCSERYDIDWKYNIGGEKLFQQYVQGIYANDVWYRLLYQSRE